MSFVWPTSHVGMAHPLSHEKNAREIGYDFLKMADSALKGVSYSDSKDRLNISSNQAETRKSLFEELGFLYVPAGSNTIILTAIGQQLFDLLGIKPNFPSSDNLIFQTDKIIIWSLLQVQINRPQSRGSPKPAIEDWQSCDIKPYATFWKAALDLDGYITLPEFFGILRPIKKVEEYPGAIMRIKDARLNKTILFKSKEEYQNRGPLMNPRIYWNSHLSVGGNLFEFDKSREALVLKGNRRDILVRFLDWKPAPPYHNLGVISAKKWTDIHEYYSRFSKVETFEIFKKGAPVVSEQNVHVFPDDLSLIFVPPPVIPRKKRKAVPKERKGRKYDYQKQDFENEVLGLKGEEYVFEIEKRRLKLLGLHLLAKKIKWVSKEQGDGLGYDIASFQDDGEPLFIEVKTTNGGIVSPFYLSDNEVRAARDLNSKYVLYRVFDFSGDVKIYKLYSPLEDYLILEPVTYRASIIPVSR